MYCFCISFYSIEKKIAHCCFSTDKIKNKNPHCAHQFLDELLETFFFA